jgi:hypothetical protein
MIVFQTLKNHLHQQLIFFIFINFGWEDTFSATKSNKNRTYSDEDRYFSQHNKCIILAILTGIRTDLNNKRFYYEFSTNESSIELLSGILTIINLNPSVSVFEWKYRYY